jgi:hypothetical protein
MKYLRPNIHQNDPEILGVNIDAWDFEVSTLFILCFGFKLFETLNSSDWLLLHPLVGHKHSMKIDEPC